MIYAGFGKSIKGVFIEDIVTEQGTIGSKSRENRSNIYVPRKAETTYSTVQQSVY